MLFEALRQGTDSEKSFLERMNMVFYELVGNG
jgi:hypothetical protein